MTRAQAGLLLMLARAAVDSTSGLLTRLLGAEGFTAASGRGLFAFAALAAILAVQARRQTWRRLTGIGALGLLFAALAAVGQVMTILSLSNTSVANFLLIFASAPFVAAVPGWAILGQRPDAATLLAALAGLAGLAVMLGILNAAFAPAWVFVGIGEVPPPATLLGGGIILAAALAHLGWTLTRPAARAAA